MHITNWPTFLENVLGFLIFLGIFIIFKYNSNKKGHDLKFLLRSIYFGLIYSLLVCLHSLHLIKHEQIQYLLKVLYLCALSFQTIYFYLFLESTRNLKPPNYNVVIISTTFSIFFFGYAILVLFYYDIVPGTPIHNFIMIVNRFAFNALALYIIGFTGIPIYYKMWRYTKEKEALRLLLSVCLISLGYLIILLYAIPGTLMEPTKFLRIFKIIGDVLPIIGILIIFISYSMNLNYIYRLPYDHYILMIISKSGLQWHSVTFKTRKNSPEIKKNLFAGLISALSTVYNSTFHSEVSISKIMSKDISILNKNLGIS